MLLLRKFYDAAVAETGAETKIETPLPSLASMMAKGGHKTENSPIVFTKETTENETQNKGKEEKPETKEPEIAATATPQKEEGKTESPKQQEEVKETQKPIAQEQPKQPTLQEVLKTVQPKAVLQAMGMDDDTVAIFEELSGYEQKAYFANLLKNIKEGKGNEYLREWNTDYGKMPSEDVMRHQLQRDYPKASAKQIDALFKKEVVEKYNLNSEDEEERTEGQLLLDAVADKHRDTFVENQKGFLTPKAAEPKAEIPDNSEQERKQNFEVYKSTVDNDPFTKDVETTGKITIGEGETAFKYKVDPSSLKDILYNPDTFTTKLFTATENADGSKTYAPDTKKQLLVATILEYGDDFLKEYANHFKSIGGKALNDSIDNASDKKTDNSSKAKKQPETLAEAMAKAGKIVG